MNDFKPDYFSENYCSPNRMASYGYQIKEVMAQKPRTVLEIGVGNGIVTHVLRRANINVTTMDVDIRVKPDVIGNIVEMPFASNAFDVLLCSQVMEHLPFDMFPLALRELCRVTSAHAVVSLPDAGRYWRIEVKIPKMNFKITTDVSWKPVDHKYDGEHYWEIGKRGYVIPIILDHIRNAGFTLIRNYRIWEYPYHRFFVLTKTPMLTSL